MADEPLEGMRGRVTVPITKEWPGEVMVMLDRGAECYTAYTAGGEELAKNSHVVVMEQTGPQTVLVTATDV